MSIRYLSLRLSLVVIAIGCGSKTPESADPPEAAPADLVTLDSAQAVSSGLGVATVGPLPADTIRLTGTITFDAGRVSHVGPRTQGRIRKVYVDVGASVQAGDTLALLDSPELGAAQARATQARIRREVAARNFERTERLFKDGVISARRRLEAEAEMRDREADLAGAVQGLSALGAESDSTATGLFVLRAPLSGEVVEKHAVAGEVVGPESTLFVVGELARVWLLLDLYESDLTRVRVGAPVRVLADAYPDRPSAAQVTLVGALVDTLSRSVRVRVEIPNPDHHLKPGMFARAGIAVASPPGTLGVPHGAVQSVGGQDVVFVPDGRLRYRTRPVTLGPPQAGGWVPVRSGLQAGDSLVVRGSFVLKAHLQRAAAPEEN